ncbi:MAG: tetratricopeptide repeat protein [Candidatus Yanofskybacteria bacterium]|nr:tetratricopeptide repeat protein [Candidatus Yanofskybacteria bacterium]
MISLAHLLGRVITWSILAAVFLVPLAFAPWTFEAFEFNKQYVLVFLALLGGTAWIARLVLDKKHALVFVPSLILFPALALLMVTALSVIFSEDLPASLFGFYGRFSDGFLGLISCATLSFLLFQEVKAGAADLTQKVWRTLLVAMGVCASVAFLSLFGAWKHIEFLPSLMQEGVFTLAAASLEGFAVLLAVFFPLILASLLLDLAPGSFWEKAQWVLLAVFFTLIAAADFLAAWIVLVAGLLVFAAWVLWQKEFSKESPFHQLVIPGFFLALSLLLLLSPLQLPLAQDREPELLLSQEVSWRVGWNTAKEQGKNLLIGSGPGTWALGFTEHKPLEFNQTAAWGIRFDRPASHLAEVLATTGLLGFLSLLLLIGIFLVASLFFISYAKRKKEREELPYANIAFLGICVLLVASLAYYQNTVLQLLFWIFLGMGAALWKGAEGWRVSFGRSQGAFLISRAVLLLIGLGFFWFSQAGARWYVADMHYLNSHAHASSLFDERIKEAEKAVLLNASQAEYRIHAAKLFLSRALAEFTKPEGEQDAAAASQDVQRALAFAQRAVELSPNRVASWETAGAIYRDIGGAPGALDWGIKAFERALALEPASPVLATELGKLYLAKGGMEKAKQKFEEAIQMRPAYYDAHIQLAGAEEREGKSERALSRLEQLVGRDPFNMEILFQLGKLYYNSNNVESAVLSLRKVLDLSPNHSNARYALGAAYEKQGKIDLAIQQFERVLQLNPEHQNVKEKLRQLQGK